MSSFVISDYLGDKLMKNATMWGVCKESSCKANVPWSREKLVSHKINSCTCSRREKDYFLSLKQKKSVVINRASDTQELVTTISSPSTVTISDLDRSQVSTISSFSNNFHQYEQPQEAPKSKKSRGIDSYLDQIGQKDIEAFNERLALFAYRTALPFNVFDSEEFKSFIKCIRPAYFPHLPTSRTLGGRLLDNIYEDSHSKLVKLLTEAKQITIVSDGWSNIRNQHLVNMMLLTDNNKPFFYKSIHTGGTEMSGLNVANILTEVIEEVGSERVVCVVTDNAPNMRAAWKIISTRFPNLFTNGCAAHVMNLFVKDICSISIYKKTLDDATFINKIIRNTQLIHYEFDKLREAFNVSHGLVIPVDTRWYTQYNTLHYLYAAKRVIISLIEHDSVQNMNCKDNKKRLVELVKCEIFWENVKTLTDILKAPTNYIGIMESDTSTAEKVYGAFAFMKDYYTSYSSIDNETRDIILDKLDKRKKFLITPSMLMAYILSPKNYQDFTSFEEYDITLEHFRSYFDRYYGEGSAQSSDCLEELYTYLSQFSTCTQEKLNAIINKSLDTRKYWHVYGEREYPLLYKIAIRLQNIPTSSAASERCWSVFTLVHSKRRNRLGNDKVEKLVFLYCNQSIFHNINDITDYASEYLHEYGIIDDL